MQAVSGVSFTIAAGQTPGLVGESGCGKTTTARVLVGLVLATWGSVRYRGEDLTGRNARVPRRRRAKMQLVFQDPYAAVDPRMSVRATLAEPMHVHGTYRDRRDARVDELLALVGLAPALGDRYPHELSGGQQQRVGIEGDVPSATDPPSGCRFRTRCWKAQDVCARDEPALVDRGQGHPVACHFADELAGAGVGGR